MIDERAIVDAKAKIGKDVHIGPFAIIGPEVVIGDGCWIDAHVIIQGRTTIGKHNKIFHFASLGAEPQHLGYNNEPTTLEIGDDNVIREYCSIHRGSNVPGYGATRIGSHNDIMAYVHIGHDCQVGDRNIFANSIALAGHVVLGNHVNLAGFVTVFQFTHIGDYCFITGSTNVYKDVPPYVLLASQHGDVKAYGLNLVGLKRNGFSPEEITGLKKAYKIIYRQNLSMQEAITELEKMVTDCPKVQGFIDTLKNSKRGIAR